MSYLRSSSDGNAGEFYFAYKVSRDIGWPCRLLDIDIGVDAQVEVCDARGISTGAFVAFQIKSTRKRKLRCRLKFQHLAYWKSLRLPVFIALVDLHSQKIYIKDIAKLRASRVTTGSFRVEFDPKKDRLTRASAEIIRMSASSAALARVKKYLKPVRSLTKEIIELVGSASECPDPDALLEAIHKRLNARKRLAQAVAVASSHRMAAVAVSKAEQDFDAALLAMHPVMKSMLPDWDYAGQGDGEIKRFLDE